MKMRSKKAVLKDIILNDESNYDMMIYKIINSGCLDNLILKIDNVPVVSNVDNTNKISSYKQFIQLLDRFVVSFKNTFPSINNASEYIIETIIYSNKSEIEKYLLSKYYLGDNNYTDFLYDSIYSIFISNFINNSKYILSIKQLLINEKIKIKDICKYNKKEICKIKDLLSSLVFCTHDKYITVYLFYNIDYELKHNLNKIDKDGCKYSKNYYEKKFIEYFINQYDFIIKDYTDKKRYLKYFR